MQLTGQETALLVRVEVNDASASDTRPLSGFKESEPQTMSVDPDPINERSSTVSPNDLKMLDHPEQGGVNNEEMGTMADIDPKLERQFDL